MLVNKINSNIVFRKVNTITDPDTNTDKKTESTILALKDTNTSVKFERNGEVSKVTEPVEKSFMRTLGYKLYKTYAAIADFGKKKDNVDKHLSVVA